MIELDFGTLAKIVNGKLVNEKMTAAVFNGVTIDSRTAGKSQLFVAISGERTDGHKYIDDAIKRKVAGIMVMHDYDGLNRLADRVPTVVVDDTHQSFMRLASEYAKKVEAEYIAITGSNGKTTTKEIAYSMIRSIEARTYRSPGNLNNMYGLPLAIFKMPSNSKYGVFEFGISKPGEMTGLTNIMKPHLAVITNVGPTHLETLGTVEGVAEAKFELADALESSTPVLINADDPELVKAAAKRRRSFSTFGIKNQADFMAEITGVDEDGFPLIKIDGDAVKLRLFGEHQIYNILAGYAVCKLLGLDLRTGDINDIDFEFAPYRGEIEHFHGLTIIADCYNANPVSMQSGLNSFRNYLSNPSLKDRRSMAVVGDMLELGKDSVRHHEYIGRLLAQCDFHCTIVVGKQSAAMYEAAVAAGLDKTRIMHFINIEDAGEVMLKNIERGDIIFFKASRGIQLEKLITLLRGAAFRQN